MSRRNAANSLRNTINSLRNRNNNMERNRNNRERSRERERNDDEDYWRNNESESENENENKNENEDSRYLAAVEQVGEVIRQECYNRMKLKDNVSLFLNLMPLIKRKVGNNKCTICLEEFKENGKIELSCGHVYHKECLENDLFEKCNFPIDPDSLKIREFDCPICKKDFTRLIKLSDTDMVQRQLKSVKIKKEEEDEILCLCFAEEGENDETTEKIEKLENQLKNLKNQKEKKDAEKTLNFIENKEKKICKETEKIKSEVEKFKKLYEIAKKKLNENEEKINYFAEQKKILHLKLGK